MAVFNPLFCAAFMARSNDVIFVAVVCLAFGQKYFTPIIMVLTVMRSFISVEPSMSLVWLLLSHFHESFREPAELTIFLLELMAIFISRRFKRSSEIQLMIYLMFDSVTDGYSLSLLGIFCLREVNKGIWANAGFLIIVFGCVICQAAFRAWWTLRIGNANFVMVGSIVYTLGLDALIYHYATNIDDDVPEPEKQKAE
jgi:hypothetical protein